MNKSAVDNNKRKPIITLQNNRTKKLSIMISILKILSLHFFILTT